MHDGNNESVYLLSCAPELFGLSISSRAVFLLLLLRLTLRTSLLLTPEKIHPCFGQTWRLASAPPHPPSEYMIYDDFRHAVVKGAVTGNGFNLFAFNFTQPNPAMVTTIRLDDDN